MAAAKCQHRKDCVHTPLLHCRWLVISVKPSSNLAIKNSLAPFVPQDALCLSFLITFGLTPIRESSKPGFLFIVGLKELQQYYADTWQKNY